MLGTSERNSPGTRTQFTGNQGTSVSADRRLDETARSWRECPASPGCSTSLARILDRGFAPPLLVRCIRLFHGISADPVNLVRTVMASDKLFGQDFYRSVFAGVATDGVRHAGRRPERSHRCRTGRQSLHRPRPARRRQRRTSPPGRSDRPGARPRSPRRRKSLRCSLSRRDCNRCPGSKASRLPAGWAEKGDIVRIPFFTVKVRICG
jgi:hypothetical protein